MSSFENKKLDLPQNDSGNESFEISESGDFSPEQKEELKNIEQLEGISLQVEKLKGEIERRKNELEGGLKESIETIADGSGLSLEEIEMAKRNSGLTESARDITDRAGSIFEKYGNLLGSFKKGLKSVVLSVAIGLSVFNVANAKDLVQERREFMDKVKFDEFRGAQEEVVEYLQSEGYLNKIKKLIKFKNVITEEDKNMTEKVAVDIAKRLRDKRVNLVKNTRLMFMPKIQLERMALLLKPYYIDMHERENVDLKRMEEQADEENVIVNDAIGGFAFKRELGESVIYVSADLLYSNLRELIDMYKHELFHIVAYTMYGDIPQDSIGLLRESHKLIDPEFISKRPDGYGFEYLGLPDEKLVRKEIVELEMKRLGIKDYNEVFTSEHLDKLLEYAKKGELSSGAMDFLKTTDPKKIIEIFNTVAESETQPKNEKEAVA